MYDNSIIDTIVHLVPLLLYYRKKAGFEIRLRNDIDYIYIYIHTRGKI